MAAIKLYELSNVFTAGPVSSTIAEVFTPLQEDIYAVMNLTNERAPFFSLQVEENEKVGKTSRMTIVSSSKELKWILLGKVRFRLGVRE